MRLIDANALKRKIKTECNPYGNPTIDFDSGKKVLEIIDNAPTIEERPKGKWKEISDNYGHSSYFCSRCGTQEGKAKDFCPNCGARME